MNGEPLQPQDAQLLQSIKDGGRWFRAVLCTLARRGVLLRQSSPERAKAILDALSTFPYYKGGQFLFDLLELEDFLLDGPPPEIVPTALSAGALQRVSAALNAVRASLDGEAAVEGAPAVQIEGGALVGDLPAIEAGFYLYQDFVLGVWASVAESGVEGEIVPG
jgi:hypothetical protein